jgi:hypothetical protein
VALPLFVALRRPVTVLLTGDMENSPQCEEASKAFDGARERRRTCSAGHSSARLAAVGWCVAFEQCFDHINHQFVWVWS